MTPFANSFDNRPKRIAWILLLLGKTISFDLNQFGGHSTQENQLFPATNQNLKSIIFADNF